MDSTKVCPDCGFEGDISYFARHRKRCKPCQRAYGRKKWANQTAEQRFKRKLYFIPKRYGISVDEVLRMFDEQGGRCACCGTPDFGKVGFSVDHCHATGKVRGILCNPCNAGLGQFADSLERLRFAVAYLERVGPSA